MANIGANYSVREYFDTEGTTAGLTIGATSTALTEATYDPDPGPQASFALITVETDQIRWWADGSTPTSTWGHLANSGDVIEIHGQGAIRNFRAIRVTTDAAIQVSYAR